MTDDSKRGTYMISAVAELYGIHPQTLRLYEREGLIQPRRSEGNTRLYSNEDLQQLELILTLTRELGVNLAGVEIILNMREKMESLQQEVGALMTYVRDEILKDDDELKQRFQQALVRVESRSLVLRREPPQPPRSGGGRPDDSGAGRGPADSGGAGSAPDDSGGGRRSRGA